MPSPYPDWWRLAEPEVHAAVSEFATWMQDKVAAIKPRDLIVKNPYLFRARAPKDAEQLASRLIDAFLSSSEETRFGDILERVAIAICQKAKGGQKSSTNGIDLEYVDGQIRNIVQIKSSTNWGNKSQREKLVSDFQSATKTLRQGSGQVVVQAVEGICYGPSGRKDYGSHIRLVGNEFWHEISDWPDTGRAVLTIVGQHASNGLSDVIDEARSRVVAYLQRSGAASNGRIEWDRLFDIIMMPTRERPK